MKKTCLLRILDEVNCVFIGLSPLDIKSLHDKYSILTDNYFFNPKFTFGAWDGKITFFHKTGLTYVHLLDELIPRVINLGYNLSLEDLRRTPNVTPKLIDENYFKDKGVINLKNGEPWVIRDYQVDLINTLLKAGGGVGIAGTGSGKTSMTAAIALSYEEVADYRSIIIVPDKGLTAQTYTEYENFTLDVGQYGGGIKDGNHQHVVSTWQTLQNHPTFIQQFQVIVVDEAHGLKGKVLHKLLTKSGKDIPFRFGVTGTLPKANCDRMSIRVAVGPTLREIPAHVLQAEGHLANLHINVIQHVIDFGDEYQDYLSITNDEPPVTYKQFCNSYLPDYTAEKKYLQSNKKRTQQIADYMTGQHNLGLGNILCLVTSIPFGKKLSALMPGSYFLCGKDDVKDRQEVYKMFNERDDLTVIATVNIAGTGLDIPRIFQMIGIDMGKSFVRVIQSIGRGLRKAADKESVTYTDICADLKYSRRHLTERKKYFKEQKYKFKLHKVEL